MLRVLLWNVFNENRDVRRIADCISLFDPDVALLQELTAAHLSCIEETFEHVVSCKDYSHFGKMTYLSIASKRPLRTVRLIEHFSENKAPASPLARMNGWVEFLETISASVSLENGGTVTFVLIHTSAGCGPSQRRTELAAASAHIPEHGPCLVGGDFNSFSEPWLAPLLAIPLSYRAGDFAVRERHSLEGWFVDRGFLPAVRGVTFPKFRLQMDHLFVRGIRLKRAEINSATWGSDHRPILAEISSSATSSRHEHAG